MGPGVDWEEYIHQVLHGDRGHRLLVSDSPFELILGDIHRLRYGHGLLIPPVAV